MYGGGGGGCRTEGGGKGGAGGGGVLGAAGHSPTHEARAMAAAKMGRA